MEVAAKISSRKPGKARLKRLGGGSYVRNSMPKGFSMVKWLALVSLCLGSGVASVGCGGAPELPGGPTPIGTDDGGGPSSDGALVDSNGTILTRDVGGRSDVVRPPNDGSCNKVSCSTDAGVYCGKIGDGCGATLDCGDCTGGQACVQNVCSTLVDGCAPLTCAQVGGAYCGSIGDGCGRALDCGGCAAPLRCGGGGISNVCGAMAGTPGCTATECVLASGQYCGVVGSGCGGKIDCGSCPAGMDCGIDGIANVCAVVGCTPASCAQAGGGRYCGVVGDGCGGKMDCGSCPSGQSCGGAGIDGVCGASTDSGACTPTDCNQANGKYCGVVGDGCGGLMECGGCGGGGRCGGMRGAGVV